MTYKELNVSTPERLTFVVSWQRPLFKASSVKRYVVTRSRSGNPDREKLYHNKTVRKEATKTIFDVEIDSVYIHESSLYLREWRQNLE